MNSDINKKSSRELKNEVMGDLKKLNRDIDQLKDHLTPGQMVDDAIFYRKSRSPRATFDYLKSNPVGTSFLALGTLLLIEDEGNRSIEGLVREKGPGYIDSAKSSVNNVKTSIKSKLRRGDETESSDSYSIDEGFEYGLDEESVSISKRVKDAKEKAKAKLGNRLQGSYESARNMEPLTYVVLGAGLGALTGASLPLMEREKNFADSRMDDKISEFTKDLEEALNQSANILKNEFVHDLTDLDLNIFRRGGPEAEASRSV